MTRLLPSLLPLASVASLLAWLASILNAALTHFAL